MSNFTCQSKSFISIFFKFQLESCNPSLAMIWQMTYTHKLPKLCSATLNVKVDDNVHELIFCRASQNLITLSDKSNRGTRSNRIMNTALLNLIESQFHLCQRASVFCLFVCMFCFSVDVQVSPQSTKICRALDLRGMQLYPALTPYRLTHLSPGLQLALEQGFATTVTEKDHQSR